MRKKKQLESTVLNSDRWEEANCSGLQVFK